MKINLRLFYMFDSVALSEETDSSTRETLIETTVAKLPKRMNNLTGKGNSLEELIVEHQPRLKAVIRKRVSSKEDAEDILQDVLYQLVKTIESTFNPIEQVTAWLYRVARNTIINKGKKMQEEELPDSSYDKGLFIVRLHTGDPCIYGAIQEQMAFFDRYKMSYHITPGISSFQAAAAALRSQFTIPEKVQSIILTRGEGRTPMPEKEQLHKLAQSQSTMCIYLSAGIVEQVQEELMQAYPPETPVAACYKLTWKEEKIYRGELKDLAKIVRDNNLTLTTLLVVGEAIDNRKGLSRLYAHEFKHLFRK